MPAARDKRVSFPVPSDTTLEESASPKVTEESHVGRRRNPSAPRHEFTVDSFLELVDDAPDAELLPAVRERLRSLPPPFRPRSEPPPAEGLGSVAPVALPEAAPFNVPTTSIAPPPRRARRPYLLAAGIVAAGAVVAAFVLRLAPVPAAVSAAAASFAPAAPPPVETAAPSASAEEPRTSLIGPLPPPTGTVIGAEGHRLWVDGHLMPDWRAEVSCGEHLVQVGSAGTPRSVDVRCDSDVIVAP